MIVVMNKHKIPEGFPRDKLVYIGRGSSVGNPYVIGVDGDRAEVIAKYEVWLVKEYQTNPRVKAWIDNFVNQVREGKEVFFQCFCKPLPCHGDVLKKFIEDKANDPI